MHSRRSQRRSVLIGSILSLAVLALSVLVFLAPAISRMLQPSIEVVALLGDAEALAEESPVWIAGRPVGTVLDVEVRGADVDSSERVAVRMRVPKKYAAQVRRDSEVRVTSRRLLGQPVIDILPGSPRAPPVQNRDSLRQRPGGTWSGLMDRAEALDANFQQFFDELETFEPRAERRTEDLERIDRQLTASAAGFRELLAGLESSAMRRLSSHEWRRLLDRLSATTRELGQAFRDTGQRARTAHREAKPSLDALAARADTIAAILSSIQDTISATGGGYLVRAQRDSAIAKGMHRAQEELDSLIAQTKRNPLRFWF